MNSLTEYAQTFTLFDKPILPPYGDDTARIMIVCSHPTYADREAGFIMGDEDDTCEIRLALEFAGLTENDIWYSTFVKCFLGKKSKPSAEQTKQFREVFEKEVELLNPKLIVCLGAEAFKAVYGKVVKQSDWLGEIIQNEKGWNILPTYTPFNIYKIDPLLRPKFQEHMLYAKRFVYDELKYDDFTYLVVDNVNTNKLILDHYMSNDMWEMGIDFEWFGEFMKDEVMHTFQYACEPNKAIILDLSKDGVEENKELLDSMKPFLENPKCKLLTWNGRAELKRLALRGFNIPEENLCFDGMKAVPFFNSSWSKGLETGIKKFTNFSPYYVDFYVKLKEAKLKKEAMSKLKFVDSETFYKYCAGDAVAHFVACKNMMKLFPERNKKLYYDIFLPLSFYFQDIELEGFEIDVPLMEQMTTAYMSCFEKLQEMLKTTLEEKGIKDFNPNSPPQKKKLLFETLNLTPVYWTKAGKNAKPNTWYVKQKKSTQQLYSPSTNSKTLSTLYYELKDKPESFEFRVVNILLNMNRVNVFANKFLSKRAVNLELDNEELEDYEFNDESEEDAIKQSYWQALSSDGRIHADYFELLKNFRASSRPNVQNPASKVLSKMPEAFALCGAETPKNLRNIFCVKEPDWYLSDLDLLGAEIAIAAFLSRDIDYINDVKSGNFHLIKMREYFQNPSLTKDEVSTYIASKSISFRVAYTAALQSAALPMQAEIFAESGNMIELERIEYSLKTWERYKTYMAYRKECNDFAKEYGYIENAYGARLELGKTDDFAIQGSKMNESLSFPISSCMAWFMWDANMKLRKHLKKEKIWDKYLRPINSIHDSAMFKIHKSLLKDWAALAHHFFCVATTLPTGDHLGLELTVGRYWKDKTPVYSNETIWHPEKQQWVWKH